MPEKTEKKPIHPIFLECAEYTFDPYWQGMFREMAHGRFPRGCKVVQNKLYFRAPRKDRGKDMEVNTVELPSDPRELYLFLTEFFRDRFRLTSDRDKKKVENDLEKAKKEIEALYQVPWAKIKKKGIKSELITDYAIWLSRKHHLSLDKLTTLENSIQAAFTHHQIENEDVIYADGRIRKIKGVFFNRKTGKFHVRPTHPENLAKEILQLETRKIVPSDVWKRYISALSKRTQAYLSYHLPISRNLARI